MQRWRPPSIRPVEALYESIEAGLTDPSDAPWDTAEQTMLELATTRGIDSAQTDLLGEAEHLASLASFITYLLRPDGPWKRPEPLSMPDGSLWHPGAFLSQSEGHLRRLVLCARWDAYVQVEQEHDWRTLEGAIYGVPMDLVVVVIGNERDGRRHGPLSKGWTHPVSKGLRFRKRDGVGFDGNWNPVFREHTEFSHGEWLDAMVEDGVLADIVHIHRAEEPEQPAQLLDLTCSNLLRTRQTEIPYPQLSRCFDRFHPCAFRSCCPKGIEPSAELGFVQITSSL